MCPPAIAKYTPVSVEEFCNNKLRNLEASKHKLMESLPIEKVENGIIYTKDHRFVKVVEVVPINFMLRSAREQRNIIYSFVSYLKIGV
jgi:hypothetical protein